MAALRELGRVVAPGDESLGHAPVHEESQSLRGHLPLLGLLRRIFAERHEGPSKLPVHEEGCGLG